MEGDRTQRAVARIEAALARIEAAARHPRSPSTDAPTADAALAARHALLRDAVGRSLAQLDQLIAEQGQ
jgi:hypothetical protein